MIIVKDVVSLGKARVDTVSLRFIISPAMIDALNLEKDDLLQVVILGIFKDSDQIKPISVNIPMPGRVIRAGSASLGVTIRKNIVTRLKLQENDEILVSVERIVSYMIVVNDVVKLGSSGVDAASLRFIISPAMIDVFKLERDDLLQLVILGIFTDSDQIEPISVNIPMPGRVIKAGTVSLGVTIRKNIATRLGLQENDEILVSAELMKRSSA